MGGTSPSLPGGSTGLPGSTGLRLGGVAGTRGAGSQAHLQVGPSRREPQTQKGDAHAEVRGSLSLPIPSSSGQSRHVATLTLSPSPLR